MNKLLIALAMLAFAVALTSAAMLPDYKDLPHYKCDHTWSPSSSAVFIIGRAKVRPCPLR